MKIVILTHPPFFQCQSIHRYTRMLAKGMTARGHDVKVWSPAPKCYRIPMSRAIKKWLGYVDQYLLFPMEIHRRIKESSPDTLFVFADHALGPWVPLVKNRPHVIHCHDLLAQRSALGEINENRISWSGRKYQALIRQGYSRGKNFISVSGKTKNDLHRFLPFQPRISEVVYNGLSQSFIQWEAPEARSLLSCDTRLNYKAGYLLHVGGNQWYKNRVGVVEIYEAWRTISKLKLPLLLIGEAPGSKLLNKVQASPFTDDIYFLEGISDACLNLFYAGASVFLFPSLAEGFGWPIAEAMASGCPVITTNEAPMTEVAGNASFLIPRRPANVEEFASWQKEAAQVIDDVINLPESKRKNIIDAGLANARRFDTDHALNQIERIYQSVL